MARGSETRDVDRAYAEKRLRQVWRGDHSQAHTLLRQVVGAGDAANALQRVVRHKAAVQYLAESVTASTLEAALRQAQTVVDFADHIHRER